MRHPFLSPTVAMIIGLSAVATRPVLAQQIADPTPLPQVAYQGRLLEGGAPVTGARVFVFSILDATGHELWNSGNQTLTVDVGLYGVVLGSTGMTPIPSSVLGKSGLLLRVAIGGTPLTPDVDILPAFQARSAWELVGAFSGDLTGTQNQTLLSNLQGIPLDLTTTAPTAGQALVFNGSKWVAGSVAGIPGPVGPQGPAGAIGPQGFVGLTGATGPQGPIGPQGLVGLTGAVGPIGPQGSTGANGLNGKTIINGLGNPVATGAGGAAGDFYLDTINNLFYGPKGNADWVGLVGVSMVGPQGAQGATGTTGVQGPQGIQGPIGLTGATGATGPQGPIGLTGAMGPQGPTGLSGVTGSTGATGPQGPIGLTGAPGATGPQGPIGLPGATGAPGPQGPIGLTGATGSTGVTGPQGPAGASPFTLNGSDAVFTTGSLGVGTSPPNASALLDLTSITKGFLPPRMNAVQRAAIVSPTAGLLVYQTDGTAGLYQFDGTVWAQVGGAGVSSISGTLPVTVTGTSTPVISMAKATGSVDGYLSAADFTTFAAKGSGTVTSVTGSGGTTGLTLGGGPITSSGTLTIGGTLNVANGGTGATTLTGYVKGTGTGALTASSTITGSDISGTVAIANGGTGQASATAALNALLPSQTGNSGLFLTTNGSGTVSWSAAGGGGGWNQTLPKASGAGASAILVTNEDSSTSQFLHAFSSTNGTAGNNLFLGTSAGNFTLGSGSTGNTGIGSLALAGLTSGTDNVGVGTNALPSLLNGTGNVSVGKDSGTQLSVGSYNVALGLQALQRSGAGVTANVGLGYQALRYIAGDENIGIGSGAMNLSGITGTGNIALGSGTGNSLSYAPGGSYNIFIGYQADAGIPDGNNQIAIGRGALTTDVNQMMLGGDGTRADRPALAQVIPGKTAFTDLGTATNRWNGVYATNVDVTGSFTVNGTPISGGGGGGVTSVAATGGGTGLTFTGGPITSTGTLTLGGTLALSNGGTGATSQQAALNAVAGGTTSGRYLRGNGTNVTLSAIQAADVPTLNQNTTGTAGNVTGTVAVANGGTGATTLTANNVLLGNGTGMLQAVAPGTTGNVLTSNGTTWVSQAASGGGSSLPSQTGNSGKYLSTNGTSTSWAAVSLLSDASQNTFAGTQALSNLPGSSNNAFGFQALLSNTSGSGNIAIGAIALNSNTTGYSNTAAGDQVMASNASGFNNCAYGAAALYSMDGANQNNAFGYQAALQTTSGVSNNAFGAFTLYSLGTGSYNTAIGESAGNAITGNSGSNVFIGAWTNGTATANNQVAIGTGAQTTADNQMVLGSNGTGTPAFAEVVPGADNATNLGSATNRWANIYVTNNVINTSDGRVKTGQTFISNGLATLMRLQPKTYFKHRSHFEGGALVLEEAGDNEAGFVAQEVSGIIPTAVHRPEDETKVLWGMRYDQVIPYTVKAVQELKAENDALRSELDTMKAELAEIKALLKR